MERSSFLYAIVCLLVLSNLYVIVLDGAAHPQECCRSSDEQRTESSEYNTKDHSQRERADAITTKDEDSQQHDQCGYRGVDCTSQCLVE